MALVLVLEWDTITELIKFQAEVDITQLDVYKSAFNQKCEFWVVVRSALA